MYTGTLLNLLVQAPVLPVRHIEVFPWVPKATIAFSPTSHRSFLGEVIATPQTTQLRITGAGVDALWGQPPESAKV